MHESLLADLRRAEALFAEYQWLGPRLLRGARKRARERALETLDCAGAAAGAEQTALLVAVSELFGALRVELAPYPADAARLAKEIEEVTGLPRIALAREVFRAPDLLTLSPAAAIEVQLTMLTAFAPLGSASLWALDNAERLKCVRNVGECAPSRSARLLAQGLLAGEGTKPSARRRLLGLTVGRPEQPRAALIASARPGMREDCHAFLTEAVPMLGSILEREGLLADNAAAERSLVESSERRLTRLGFDLHDGPVQEITLLAEDLRLFKDQLETLLTTPVQRRLVRGRMEDIDAQLMALEAELRRLSSEVHAPTLLNRSFPRALRDVIQAFAARTNIEPRLTLRGDMRLLSVSQQIALLNIIHEALANVREHGDATEAEVVVSARADGVEARIADNGRGFELETTLARAAREGRLGLVAISERVRLLGGQCRIDSRPGGPTVISVALERWEPVQSEVQPSRAVA